MHVGGSVALDLGILNLIVILGLNSLGDFLSAVYIGMLFS